MEYLSYGKHIVKYEESGKLLFYSEHLAKHFQRKWLRVWIFHMLSVFKYGFSSKSSMLLHSAFPSSKRSVPFKVDLFSPLYFIGKHPVKSYTSFQNTGDLYFTVGIHI